ncbi:MAG: molybdopterin oxidoreductase family protein [Myxococcales bacterium]
MLWTSIVRESRDSIADIWGDRTPTDRSWTARVDERVVEEPERWVQSCCVLCSNGCALDIGVKGNRIVGVRGRAEDRVNRGRLGPKGLHGWEANAAPGRLTGPLVRNDGELRPASWEEAMGRVVQRTRELLHETGSGAIGFYTTGQLFLEEYYTLATIARAGLGTLHVDGNTRLCTATAAMALIESFGADGDPGSYEDFDVCDTLFLVGHNMAATQTVLWSRVLDRRKGPNPPRLIVVDPRTTGTAREADLHLRPRPATNLALLNGLLHLVLESGRVDREFLAQHTAGFDELQETVGRWPPERAAQVTGISIEDLRKAAAMLGSAERLVSTCLQGVYQSHQATAAAVQVNNLHLVRGMLGKPGCTVFQMNGQPTAQNTRECGADGELVAFRNWNNQRHVEDLARLWNVEPRRIAHWAPPTHAMQIFRLAETGSIRMLWISGTNPAVSLPDLARIRRILDKESLFLVVQDAFLSETAEHADVVFPAALWGEKTGTFTNADRTVHVSHKAIDPPGEAKSDLQIFLDYARAMDLRDDSGAPLVKWTDAEGAFAAFREVTRGRPCDYTGLSHAKLTGRSGIQWPCNAAHPEGRARLYEDGVFPTGADVCETYGHDLVTGAAIEEMEYRARDPAGRARIKAADWHPPHEQPDRRYPFWLTTGRLVYHWHTRTKTGKSRALQEAAPVAFVQVSEADARRLGISDGDGVEIETRRGKLALPARVGEIAEGTLFMPFHYGDHAANELTLTTWDPVSKQPSFKYAAARMRKIGKRS